MRNITNLIKTEERKKCLRHNLVGHGEVRTCRTSQSSLGVPRLCYGNRMGQIEKSWAY